MLIIIVCVLLALLLLSLLRVGGTVHYSAEGLRIRARLGPASLTVFPVRKKKPGREKKPKKKREQTLEETPAPTGGSFALLRDCLPLVGEAAGRLKRKIRVDKLLLDFTAGAANPARAAMSFGYANAALGMIWPQLEHNFNIKEHRIRTAVDFNRTAPVICLYAVFTLTLGQAVALGVNLLFKFLRIYARHRDENKPEVKQKEAVSNVGK